MSLLPTRRAWVGPWFEPVAGLCADDNGSKCQQLYRGFSKTAAACQMRCNAQAGCAGFEYHRSGSLCTLCGNDFITRTNKAPAVTCFIKRSGERVAPLSWQLTTVYDEDAPPPPPSAQPPPGGEAGIHRDCCASADRDLSAHSQFPGMR